MTNTTNSLKPCPFCGGEARLTRWGRGFWPVADHRGGCPINDMRPPDWGWYITEKDAAQAWNMRTEYETMEIAYMKACAALKEYGAMKERIAELEQALNMRGGEDG